MTNRSTLLTELATHADALTESGVHREPRWTWDVNRNRKPLEPWITVQPSLLAQLSAAVVPGETYAQAGVSVRITPRSTPPARLDAIDRCKAIESAAARWCGSLRLPPRADTAGNIRALVGASAVLDPDTIAALLTEVRAWRYWAATVVGWLTPPWRPLAPCPMCSVADRLRVRLDLGTACCMACGTAWSPDTIDLLAQTVRAYRDNSRAQKLASSKESRRLLEEKVRPPLTSTARDVR